MQKMPRFARHDRVKRYARANNEQRKKVEPQGIEPWSREDDNRTFYMLS
jgi:hypothetical protein